VDFNCTSEEWQVAIRVRDELLLPMAQILGEERGQRIWKACIEKEPEVQLCFQGIQASTKHQALTLLRDAGIDAGDEEWHRATCVIRRRRGARPPLAAVTLLVRPNEPLRQLLVGQRGLGQDKIEIWKCREGEQLQNVTTLIQDPEAGGHSLRSWTRIYGLLGISEAIQRELVLLSLMLEQPSFVPLDMLGGNRCCVDVSFADGPPAAPGADFGVCGPPSGPSVSARADFCAAVRFCPRSIVPFSPSTIWAVFGLPVTGH